VASYKLLLTKCIKTEREALLW